MKYYINDFIKLKKVGKIYLIYSPNYNDLVYVSENLFRSLKRLKNKYKNSEIFSDDILFDQIKKSNSFNLLEKKGIIYLSGNKFKRKEIDINEVYLHLTHACNLKCTYCYDKKNFSYGFIDNNTINNVNEFVLEHKVKKIILTGGEPLLHNNINDIVDIIRYKKNIKIHLLTNGTLIHKNLELLRKVDLIIISLDSIKSTNRKGLDASSVIKNISLLPNEIKKKIIIRSVISKGEENLVNENKEFFKSLGVSFTWVPNIPNNKKGIKYYPDFNNIKNINSSFLGTNILSNCGACSKVIAIDYNGNVYSCQNLITKNMKICNINSEKFEDEYKNSIITNKFLELNINKIKSCKDCNLKYLCGSGCRAIAYKVYDSIFEKIHFMCEDLKNMVNCDFEKELYE